MTGGLRHAREATEPPQETNRSDPPLPPQGVEGAAGEGPERVKDHFFCLLLKNGLTPKPIPMQKETIVPPVSSK